MAWSFRAAGCGEGGGGCAGGERDRRVGRGGRVAAAEHPQGHGRPQQRRGLGQQADHVVERGLDHRVGGGCGHDPVEVAAHQAVGRRRRAAPGLRVAQVLAGGHRPGPGVGLGYRLLYRPGAADEPALVPGPVGGQGPLDRLGGQGGGAHALAVDGVEGAGGVAQRHEPVGQAHVLVVAAAVGRAPVAGDGRHGGHPGDGVGDVGRSQAAGEGGEPLLVGGREVGVGAGQREHPAVALDGEADAHAGGVGRLGLEENRLQPGHDLVTGAPVDAGRIAQLGVDQGLAGPAVAGGVQPVGGGRAAAAGVDDQVGGQPLGRVAGLRATGPQVDADHPVGVDGQVGHLDAGAQGDAPGGQHPAADGVLDEVAAG
jgi:hypothetical protein